ncbi:hypothetical protein C5167_014158 [Papaver somniferum]|uniref:Uncharacterized protein n=1 Tax=Papaver somniferum TaxID=3469 RepID=A0A4Y7J6E8_PAPSO|nr:hypothetical protein C5167_014158 [Papaver somniferum]
MKEKQWYLPSQYEETAWTSFGHQKAMYSDTCFVQRYSSEGWESYGFVHLAGQTH